MRSLSSAIALLPVPVVDDQQERLRQGGLREAHAVVLALGIVRPVEQVGVERPERCEIHLPIIGFDERKHHARVRGHPDIPEKLVLRAAEFRPVVDAGDGEPVAVDRRAGGGTGP
jgi:hypothetical protein